MSTNPYTDVTWTRKSWRTQRDSWADAVRQPSRLCWWSDWGRMTKDCLQDGGKECGGEGAQHRRSRADVFVSRNNTKAIRTTEGGDDGR